MMVVDPKPPLLLHRGGTKLHFYFRGPFMRTRGWEPQSEEEPSKPQVAKLVRPWTPGPGGNEPIPGSRGQGRTAGIQQMGLEADPKGVPSLKVATRLLAARLTDIERQEISAAAQRKFSPLNFQLKTHLVNHQSLGVF